jgi:hypothetical protein
VLHTVDQWKHNAEREREQENMKKTTTESASFGDVQNANNKRTTRTRNAPIRTRLHSQHFEFAIFGRGFARMLRV